MTIPKLLLAMARPRVLFILFLFACLALVSSRANIDSHVTDILQVFIILTLWYVNGTCLNDLADRQIDLINLRGASSRPYANNKASAKQLMLLALVSGLLSILLSLSIGLKAMLIVGLALLLNWSYSMKPIRISYRGVLAPLLLPLGYVTLPFILSFLSLHQPVQSFPVMIWGGAYLTFMGRIVLKDFRDVSGDKKFGKRTFIVRYGSKATILFSGAFLCMGTGILSYEWRSPFVGLSILVSLQGIAALYCLSLLGKSKDFHEQQVIIGSIARITTGGLICAILTYNFYAQAKQITPIQEIAIFALGIFAIIYGIKAITNQKLVNIKY